MTSMPDEGRPYHHGDLPRALLAAAIEVIEEVGPGALSLREVARRAGVSHAAPAHHFGDKAGLLTAVAIEGYRLVRQALVDAAQQTGDFREVGVAYVTFARTHRAHFEVMYRPELYHADDPVLVEAREAASATLYGPTTELTGEAASGALAGVAAWSLVHGFATLWLNGNLDHVVQGEPEDAARAVTRFLALRRR
jgi:AcrR family transcriptional regulator